MNRFYLSPCGISILLSFGDKEFNKLIITFANEKDPKNIPKEIRQKIEEQTAEIEKTFFSTDIRSIRTFSAELNGLLLHYDDSFDPRGDYHLLLCTDTWLGELCAKIAEKWLAQHGAICEVYRQQGLQTQDVQDFHFALSELAPELLRRIREFKKAKNRIIFNLTAGFKAVQGFLQSLGMLHADEMVYVFERTNHLIRIPKIPLEISSKVQIRDHLDAFRKLTNGLEICNDDMKNVPETMILNIGGDYALSTWGAIFWAEARNEIYAEKLLPPLSEQVRYSSNFIKDTKDLDGERLAILNYRIDQLCRFFSKNENPKSLSFKSLKGSPIPGSTHEFYAWSDKEAARVFAHFDGDDFIIDKLDAHL